MNEQLGLYGSEERRKCTIPSFFDRVLYSHKQLQHGYWYRFKHLVFRMTNLGRKTHTAPFSLSRADWRVSIYS